MPRPPYATFHVFVISAGFVFGAIAAAAAEDCATPVGSLVSVQGLVEVQRAGSVDWQPVMLGALLCEGDLLRIGERSRIEASLSNQVKIRADQNTTLRLISPPDRPVTWLGLLSGAAYFFSRQPRSLNVDTPFVNAAVEGTEFVIRVADEHTEIGVFNGKVVARNAFGEASITNGGSSVASAYAAPTETLLVRPFDAVQWAMYFPPVLDVASAASRLSPEVWQAVDLASQGRTAEAFARFEAIPPDERDAAFYLYRAQTLLAVGRVDEAEADLQQTLALDPGNAEAYAVQAVIAVSRNQQDEALQLAQHAVELAPTSAAAKIALSFAEQARFQIEAARDAVQQAVEDEPDNALAWARLSELWLMLGFRDRAVETARHARGLAPDLARVQTVLGFAALAEFDRRRAEKAFRLAIERDQADPQPRFGLGLALIRGGALRDGRAEIEGAVLLDPNNSLLRSYLGKAYFEEKRDHLSSQQYELAKELDPNDPTPWFYDAILKQTENRPVEALHDLQKSMELNDNRAVFRSRELLDQDQAARGASLGRIYDDLGFQRLGVNAATRALSLDPASASAHRFLSDVYATEPRHEIARVSELLQAQLLQDVNINPVQPSLAVTNLNIVTTGGPARPGFNEFTRLFESNGAQLNATGLIGNQETLGNEAVVSGLYDRYSVSAGQFHYETDGFRDNDDINYDIYNFFAQTAITPALNVQTELRRATSEHGDTSLSFDHSFDPDAEVKINNNSARIGARYSLTPSSTLLFSVIGGNFDYSVTSKTNNSDQRQRVAGLQNEAQYIFSSPANRLVSGIDYSLSSNDIRVRNADDDSNPISDSYDANYGSSYAYYEVKPFPDVMLTLGMSLDKFSAKDYNVIDLNPKFGLQWSITQNTTIRLAAFRTLKPPLITSRTIQPTQVAGFNQYFDDFDGTKAWRYGGGLDYQINSNLAIGAEASARQLDIPITPFEFTGDKNTQHFNSNEQLYRGYIYWTPNKTISASYDMLYDITDGDLMNINTLSMPLSLRYFHESGLFGVITPTYTYQEVDNNGNRDDGFITMDAAIGYRLPYRYGLASIEVRNITDKKFKYQDDQGRSATLFIPTFQRLLPERAFTARLIVNLN